MFYDKRLLVWFGLGGSCSFMLWSCLHLFVWFGLGGVGVVVFNWFTNHLHLLPGVGFVLVFCWVSVLSVSFGGGAVVAGVVFLLLSCQALGGLLCYGSFFCYRFGCCCAACGWCVFVTSGCLGLFIWRVCVLVCHVLFVWLGCVWLVVVCVVVVAVLCSVRVVGIVGVSGVVGCWLLSWGCVFGSLDGVVVAHRMGLAGLW